MIKSIWQNKGLYDLTECIFLGLLFIRATCMDEMDKMTVGSTWTIIFIAIICIIIQCKKAMNAKKKNNVIYKNPQFVCVNMEDCDIQKVNRGHFVVYCIISYMHKIDDKIYKLSDMFEITIKENEKKFNDAVNMISEIKFVYAKQNPSCNMMIKDKRLKAIDNIDKKKGWRDDKIALIWFVLDILSIIGMVHSMNGFSVFF